MELKEKNKKNFQGEITSGFIMKLIKITQENRRLGRQQQQKERGKYDNIRQSKNLFSKN